MFANRSRWIVTLALLALAAPVLAGPIRVPNQGWSTYKGAWFSIKYPKGFTPKVREVVAGMKGSRAAGASFLSADGQVEFYVYSPQWNGTSQWARVQTGETVASRSAQTKGQVVTTWVTVKGKGYERSWVDTENKGTNTRKIFGYKYRSQAAYRAYKPLYLKFKASLQQFAD